MRMRSVKIIIVLMILVSSAGILFSGCNAKPSDAATEKGKPSEPAGEFDNSSSFAELVTTITDMEVESVGIIRIDDIINSDSNLERQVRQEILEELTKVEELEIIEKDSEELKLFLATKKVDPKRGLSSAQATDIADFFEVDAVLYGTVESQTDLNLKMYLAENGGVIFARTISNLQLPLTKKAVDFETPDNMDNVPLSEATKKEFGLDKKSDDDSKSTDKKPKSSDEKSK
jgi:hypothetical protein